MIRALLEFAGKRLKGDVFALDPDIPTFAILRFAGSRAIQALRGMARYPWLAPGSALPAFFGHKVRVRSSRKVRIGRGVTIGDHVLIEGLSRDGVDIGAGVNIGAHTIIMPTSVVRNLGRGFRIGANSGIGQYAFIGCGAGVTIGQDVIMGQFVSFHTENHLFADPDVPIRLQGVTRSAITIGDDCWIGAKVTFLSGATVGRGCVVAAGAVVRGDIPPYSVIGGVPARILSTRHKEDPLPDKPIVMPASAA